MQTSQSLFSPSDKQEDESYSVSFVCRYPSVSIEVPVSVCTGWVYVERELRVDDGDEDDDTSSPLVSMESSMFTCGIGTPIYIYIYTQIDRDEYLFMYRRYIRLWLWVIEECDRVRLGLSFSLFLLRGSE